MTASRKFWKQLVHIESIFPSLNPHPLSSLKSFQPRLPHNLQKPLQLELSTTMSHSALTTNLSFSLPSQKMRVSPVFHRLSPSSPRKPMCLAVKAIGGEGSGDLDHLQRAPTSKMRQQQQQQSSLQQQKRRTAQPAPFGLWDRFPTARTVNQMMDTMERIMADPFAYTGALLPSLSDDESLGSYRRGRTPWEIIEGEGEYKMRFDMPGMTKKDVKIWVEEKTLVVKAEKQAKEGGEEEEWSSKSYGRYNSRIELPDNVEVEKIKAEVKDGVLYITIPKVSSSSKVMDIDVQ